MYFVSFQPNKKNRNNTLSEYYKFICEDPVWCTGYTGPKQVIADAILAGPGYPEKIIIFETNKYNTVNSIKWNIYLGRYFIYDCCKNKNKNHYKNRKIDFWNDFDKGINHHEYIVDKKDIKPIIECTLTKNGKLIYDEDGFNKIIEICSNNPLIHKEYIKTQISFFFNVVGYLYENNKHKSEYDKIEYIKTVHELFTLCILPSIMAALTKGKLVEWFGNRTDPLAFLANFYDFFDRCNEKHKYNEWELSNKKVDDNEIILRLRGRNEALYRYIYKYTKILNIEEINIINEQSIMLENLKQKQ